MSNTEPDYVPTPEEIAKAAEEIRNSWCERTKMKRAPHLIEGPVEVKNYDGTMKKIDPVAKSSMKYNG